MTEPQKSKGAKTLDNGLHVLELITEHPGELTLTEVAAKAKIHPTSVHRLITSLEAKRLVRRDTQKYLHPGYGLIKLASSVDRVLQATAEPVMQRMTDKIGATSHLVVAISETEVMAQLVVQPRQSLGHVAFSPGRVDPINHGSAGIAILSGKTGLEDVSSEVAKARHNGYAVSKGAIIPNVIGISAPIRTPEGIPDSAIGLSLVTEDDFDLAIAEVKKAAQEIEKRLWRY